MYSIYESLGYVWMERSTDNGLTWELMNNGKPIGNTLGKSPSMDYSPSGNLVLITYLKWEYGNVYKLVYSVYEPISNTFREDEVKWDIDPEATQYFTDDAQAVVAWNGNGHALFVTKGYAGIHYVMCELSATTTTWIEQSKGSFGSGIILNTPTLYATKIDVGPTPASQYFHLAYQKNNVDIYYRNIEWNEHTGLVVHNEEQVSTNTGYTVHRKPSITATDYVDQYGDRTEYIRLAWIGFRSADVDDPCAVAAGETRVLYKFRTLLNWSGLSVYGSNVNSVNINKGSTIFSDNFEPYSIAWSEGNNCNFPNKYVRSHPPKVIIRTLSTTGDDIQINNSVDFYDMYVNSFHKPNLPYYFNLSENLSGGLEKIESFEIYQGREGVISKDTTDFYYAIGDITIDGENVEFVEMPDSIVINDLQLMNEYLVSEPFSVTSTSILTYGVQYGVTDSVSAVTALSDSTEISFRVELVDVQTNEVLGVFDEVTFNSENVFQYDNIGYEVDLSGIGNRTLKLSLVAGTTSECGYSLSKRYSDSESLNKKGTKQLTLTGNFVITEYALNQNYPNPFNPTTTIKYQIPKSGNVTLKIYDVLGSEVATLVNSFQNEGRYEANFNASSLASGVYIYRLSVNDFVSVKKMLVLK
jgi:hypothetical protein